MQFDCYLNMYMYCVLVAYTSVDDYFLSLNKNECSHHIGDDKNGFSVISN